MPLFIFCFKAFIDNLDQQANEQNTLYLLLSKSKKKKSLKLKPMTMYFFKDVPNNNVFGCFLFQKCG